MPDVPREYATDNYIESSQIIGSSANSITVRYYPGFSNETVELTEGFAAKQNTLFEVWIEGCL